MNTTTNTAVTVACTVNAPVEKVWKFFTEPKHIMNWTFASDDWHAPHAENDLRENGTFTTTMAAKDGSMQFDFGGTYTKVTDLKQINYVMGDGRKVFVSFTSDGNSTTVSESFDIENEHPADMQRDGWQAILNNFKKYVESN